MERSLRESRGRVPRLGRGRQTRGEPAPKGGVGMHRSKETDLLIPAAQGKSDERVKSEFDEWCSPEVGLCQKPGLGRSHSVQRGRAAGGAGASANMAALETAGRGRRPHGARRQDSGPLPIGSGGHSVRCPLDSPPGTGDAGAHSAPPPPHSPPPRPGLPRAPRNAGLRAVGLGGSRAEPGRTPNPRRPARFTLACNRVGAHARQVQVPLRCAEGTYSWCSRLLAVSHTRR